MMVVDVYSELVSTRAFGSYETLEDYITFVLKRSKIIDDTPKNSYATDIVVTFDKTTNKVELFDSDKVPLSNNNLFKGSLESLIMGALCNFTVRTTLNGVKVNLVRSANGLNSKTCKECLNRFMTESISSRLSS